MYRNELSVLQVKYKKVTQELIQEKKKAMYLEKELESVRSQNEQEKTKIMQEVEIEKERIAKLKHYQVEAQNEKRLNEILKIQLNEKQLEITKNKQKLRYVRESWSRSSRQPASFLKSSPRPPAPLQALSSPLCPPLRSLLSFSVSLI